MPSARAMAFSYQPFAPLRPSISRIPVWRGSKAKSTRYATVLNAQFLHIRKARTFDRIHIGPSQYRSKHLEQIDLTANGNLLGFSQSREPLLELVGRFDVPCHSCNITLVLCTVKRKRRHRKTLPPWNCTIAPNL